VLHTLQLSTGPVPAEHTPQTSLGAVATILASALCKISLAGPRVYLREQATLTCANWVSADQVPGSALAGTTEMAVARTTTETIAAFIFISEPASVSHLFYTESFPNIMNCLSTFLEPMLDTLPSDELVRHLADQLARGPRARQTGRRRSRRVGARGDCSGFACGPMHHCSP
jgi:hypothetical protein